METQDLGDLVVGFHLPFFVDDIVGEGLLVSRFVERGGNLGAAPAPRLIGGDNNCLLAEFIPNLGDGIVQGRGCECSQTHRAILDLRQSLDFGFGVDLVL